MSQTYQHTDLEDKIKTLERLLSVKQLQINSLLEVSQAINNNFSTSALFRIYEFILRAQIGIQKMLVYLEDEGWFCACKSGTDTNPDSISIKDDLLPYKKITKLTEPANEKLYEFEIVIPVYHKEKPLAFVLLGALQADEHTSMEEKIKFIQTITNIILVANENKKLFRHLVNKEVFEKELELAARMQSMLIPHELPHDDNVEMAAIYLPHHNVGGDYYDYIQLNEDQIAFCIGDISGKGIAAALLMANFQANLRTHIHRMESLDNHIDFLNQQVGKITNGEKFITLFLGIYNSKTRKLHYVNAGHNPPLLYNNSTLQELQKGCTLLGMFDELPSIETGEVELHKDAVLLNYTDGLVDFENHEGEFFGVERLTDYFWNNLELPMEDFNQQLLNYIEDYKADSSFSDDITLLSCRFY